MSSLESPRIWVSSRVPDRVSELLERPSALGVARCERDPVHRCSSAALTAERDYQVVSPLGRLCVMVRMRTREPMISKQLGSRFFGIKRRAYRIESMLIVDVAARARAFTCDKRQRWDTIPQ